MEKYVFYYKELATKVFAKSALSKDDIRQLKEEGFKKYPLEFAAENKQDAIKKLNENSRENFDELSQFSGNILLLVIVMLITMALIYLFPLR
ncbi:hypothetical protein EHN07_13995 [Buttiauxella warmboldiae]|uniref:Uncharacterized protein n=1 Tax=Buttiauxella warmboldiae TaxID=82993 RepID=A0A3N5D8Z6_9ENTR|nr:hypothetical protein [Buttiauxella warmboldiae]RPH24768.1 hypothetical protein EHN07_13995 [Buttiauxella warmboldiae]